MKFTILGYYTICFLLILSSILYFTSPNSFDEEYVNYNFIIFLLSAFILLYNNMKIYKSIFIFESLFAFSFLFVNYIYPVVIYSIDPYFSLFSRAFNENIITKSTSLATIAYTAYCIGIFQKKRPKMSSGRKLLLKPISTKDLVIMSLLLIFFVIGNIAALLGGYSMSGSGGFFFIFSIFYVYKFLAFSYKKISVGKTMYFYILLLSYIVLNLIMGNRGEPLYLFVAFIFCYNKFVKKIPFTKFVFLGIIGLLIFYIVGKVRISSNQVGIQSQSEKLNALEGEDNVLRYANELIINNRALYVLVDYADKEDFTYGLTWSMSFFSIVPFGQSFALYCLGIPPKLISSTYLTTRLEFSEGDENSFGMGTNLVGDIYLCFGYLGVVLFMLLFGKVIRYIHNKSLYGRSYYQIAYIIFIFLAVYFPRATLFSPLQMLAWTYALTLIYNKNGKVYLRGLRRIPIQK